MGCFMLRFVWFHSILFDLHKILKIGFVFFFSTASDASGRYRGQFLFENHHWLGSMVACENLGRIDEMELGFYVATTRIHSPEPMIKVRKIKLCSTINCNSSNNQTHFPLSVSVHLSSLQNARFTQVCICNEVNEIYYLSIVCM